MPGHGDAARARAAALGDARPGRGRARHRGGGDGQRVLHRRRAVPRRLAVALIGLAAAAARASAGAGAAPARRAGRRRRRARRRAPDADLRADVPARVQVGARDGRRWASVLGQLARPLEAIQVAGVWLSENYALPVVGALEESLTYRLSWFVVALAVVGVVVLARRRRPGPLLPALAALLAWQLVAPRASRLRRREAARARARPAVVFLALCGALALRGPAALRSGVGGGRRRRRSPRSRARRGAYHGVRIAPVDRMHALEAAVDRVADRGPIMLDEVEEFAKYYGRRAPQLNVGFEAITVRFAEPFGGGYHVDLDQLDAGLRAELRRDRHAPRAGDEPPAGELPAGVRRTASTRSGRRIRACACARTCRRAPCSTPAASCAATPSGGSRGAPARRPPRRRARRPRPPSCRSSTRRTGRPAGRRSPSRRASSSRARPGSSRARCASRAAPTTPGCAPAPAGG